MFKIITFNSKQLLKDSLYRIIIPVSAVIILLVSFIIANAVITKDNVGQEDARFELPHECCLSYDIHEQNVAIEASAGNIRRWGLSWVNKGSEPQTDPGSSEILNKYNALYRGDPDEKVIYLTFDMGYEAGYTSELLDILKAKNVKAVFFLLSNYLTRNPDLVRRMINEGHYIGNHTVNHKCLPLLTSTEIVKELSTFNAQLEAEFGAKSDFFRTPKGEYNELVLKTAQDMNMTTLFWSFGYKDWEKDAPKGADYAVQHITSKLHNGMLMLLHNVNADNVGALERVITIAMSKGYSIGDPAELKK